ncbi:MAG: nucleotidyltransferase domain-containing protein [Gaiellaceae bacterium]
MRWDDAEWEPWRPEEVARRLRDVGVPWYVTAGWAIDLFLGRQRRDHEDLEIGVPAVRFDEVAPALADLELFVPVGGGELEPLDQELLAGSHQTWALDPTPNVWRVDVFREPSENGEWISRRDDRIRLPYAELVEHTPGGVPYARPEVVLLFKAKHARPKDESDLAAVLPHLDASRRRLLAEWIALVHPGHFWLPDLA